MGKRGGNKLKYQVEQALKKINNIGLSKHEFEQQGKETGIHSIKQMKETLSTGQNFAKWLKENNIRDLYQLKRSHYRKYIDYMKEKGVSNGHLINTETNLKLLQKGMNAVSSDKGFKARDWCPKQRLIKVSSREQSVNRSLDTEQIEKVYERLSDSAKISADLQLAFGLRLREVAKTTIDYIVEKDGDLYWSALADRNAKNTAVGVTKGGRGRLTPCRSDMKDRIYQIIQNKPSQSVLVPIGYNSIRSAYKRAKLNGSHVFRHTYARYMLKSEFEKLGIEKNGRDLVERMVHNRAAGFRKDYQIEKLERTLYKQVNQAIDRVHKFLGHGVSRSDLMQVYMKE